MTVQGSATFKNYLEATLDRPVYVILGVQGSGTNMLSRLLVKVFGFSVLHDRALVFNTAARLGAAPDPAMVAREIERFGVLIAPSVAHRRIGRKFIQKSAPFEGVLNELQSAGVRHAADFARIVYAYRTFKIGGLETAIKSDDIWEHLDAIDTVLPNRRIILLTRDFRDNLLSVGGKRFGPIEPLCAAQYVKKRFAIYDAEYRRSGTAGFHVKFETLVQTPHRFVEDFSRHFGVRPAKDPTDALAGFHVRSNKIAKWKSLDPQTLSWCEGLLESELRAYDYELASPVPALPPPAALLAARSRDVLRRVPQKLARVFERLKG